MQNRRESGSSIASSVHSYDSRSTMTNSDVGDHAIMSRIRKSCEQKEEFLRRPSQPYVYNVASASQTNSTAHRKTSLGSLTSPPPYSGQMSLQSIAEPPRHQVQVDVHSIPSHASQMAARAGVNSNGHNQISMLNSSPQKHPVIFENIAVTGNPQYPQHREFYSRPNRLQKACWPPAYELTVSPPASLTPQPSSGTNSVGTSTPGMVQSGTPFTSPPLSAKQAQHLSIREQFFLQQQQQREQSPKRVLTNGDQPLQLTEQQKKDLPHQTLRMVSELTKQFSSGRPLSPDGIDRTSLYRSELSRLQQKQVHPTVALRKREFEALRGDSSELRRSMDKARSSSADAEPHNGQQLRARSLSAESSHFEKTTRDDPPVPPPREKHKEKDNKENFGGISSAAKNNTNGKLMSKVKFVPTLNHLKHYKITLNTHQNLHNSINPLSFFLLSSSHTHTLSLSRSCTLHLLINS